MDRPLTLEEIPSRRRLPRWVVAAMAVVGPETVCPGHATVSEKDVTDGPGMTILLVENQGAGVHWMEPRDLSFAEMDFAVNSPRSASSRYGNAAVVTLDDTVFRLQP